MIGSLFPTTIYYNDVSDPIKINNHIDNVIDEIDFKIIEEWGTTHYISVDFSLDSVDILNVDILNKYKLHEVSKEIDKNLRDYCTALNFKMREYSIESWFSKFKKGNYAHIHHHGHADISGVYYYKTNSEDGTFFFESPNPYSNMCYSNSRWNLKPSPGQMVMFPGWMSHGVTTNTTDNTRISLSFNIYFKKNQGLVMSNV